MYLTIVALPFICFCFTGLFGKNLGSFGTSRLSITISGLAFFISVIIFYEVAINNCPVYIKITTWIDSGILNINWGFLFDSLTAIMCCVITFISFLVQIYSIDYMSNDPHLPRFMCYLSLFTFFMLILVTADNFIQMFVGWEGVGLCSYLLINFWYTRIQANKAAIKAMVINRIGDFGLVLGILIIFVNYKTVEYSSVFAVTPLLKEKTVNILNTDFNLLYIVSLFLFIGVIGKSAQIGLHTWLPDAMEGPTPVSALIHAATMVTAGVFLITRCSPLYNLTESILNYVIVIGSVSSFFAATIGLLQNDLKKVIAYSTCSQLGYMVYVCGLSQFSVGIFHLTNHAFFKALLFLGAGSIIHALLDEQDLRKMGGLKKLLPFTYSVMTIGSLALIGFPFLSGFYSKDLILEVSFGKFTTSSHFSYYLGTFSAFLTTFYSTRLIFLTFLSSPNGYRPVIENAVDTSFKIGFVLSTLSVPSIFIGFFYKDMLVGWGSFFWGNSVLNSTRTLNSVDAEFINFYSKIAPILCNLIILVLSFILYIKGNKILFFIKKTKLGRNLYTFMIKKWFFDKIIVEFVGQLFFKFSYSVSYKIIDRGIFEILGPTGLSHIMSKLSFNISKNSQTKDIYHYLLITLTSITILINVRYFWILLGNNFDYRLAFMFFFTILSYNNQLKSNKF